MIKMALEFISCSKDCQYCCPAHARRQRDKSKFWISSIPTIAPQDLQSTVGCLALCTRALLFCHLMPRPSHNSWKREVGGSRHSNRVTHDPEQPSTPNVKHYCAPSSPSRNSRNQFLLYSFLNFLFWTFFLRIEWNDLEQNSFQRRCVVQSINFPTIELKKKQSLCISTRLKYLSVYFSLG